MLMWLGTWVVHIERLKRTDAFVLFPFAALITYANGNKTNASVRFNLSMCTTHVQSYINIAYLESFHPKTLLLYFMHI